MHNAIQTDHMMVGVDSHDGILAIGDIPKPMPHLVCATTKWGVPPKMSTRTFGTGGKAFIFKGSDIGMGIPHISPNLFVPLCMFGSGSKSHFGPSRVRVEGQTPAGALACAVDINLNCAGPTKLPASALVIAPNTVHYGMTFGDILAGMLTRGADAWMQHGINRALGSERLARFIGRRLHARYVRRLVSTKLPLSLSTALLLSKSKVLSNQYVATTLGNFSTSFLGFAAGSPLSNSLGGTVAQLTGNPSLEILSPVGAETGWISEKIDTAAHGVDELLDPPDVETVN